MVQGAVRCSQHCPKQLCDKAFPAPRCRDSQGTDYVSNCRDHGEMGQVRLWLGSLHRTDAVSPSQILCYPSRTPGGEGEQLISSLQHKVSGEHPAPLSCRTSSLLLLFSCKRCVLTWCLFRAQPTTQQHLTHGPLSGWTTFLVLNVLSLVSSTPLSGLEMPSIHAGSYLAESVLSAVCPTSSS